MYFLFADSSLNFLWSALYVLLNILSLVWVVALTLPPCLCSKIVPNMYSYLINFLYLFVSFRILFCFVLFWVFLVIALLNYCHPVINKSLKYCFWTLLLALVFFDVNSKFLAQILLAVKCMTLYFKLLDVKISLFYSIP